MLTHSNIVCADQAASDRFCPVKTGESQRREPFAKLPEGLYRKPYFHIYHIISHSKKIVKAFGHENLDYLCILLKKRIVKSDRIAKGRGVRGRRPLQIYNAHASVSRLPDRLYHPIVGVGALDDPDCERVGQVVPSTCYAREFRL